jgi:ADP-ribose pyrophosphatase YjhB (NUDIX family)
VRLKLIACEVLYREMCAAVARAPHQVDIEFLPKGLHDLGGGIMRARLQELVDAADPALHDALLFGYALCGNGVAGLRSRGVPLVIPRAHDCIGLLLGSRQRYKEYFDSSPGVYFRSTGWLERGEGLDQATMRAVRDRTGSGYTLEDLIARYGEDNGRYLFDEFSGYQRSYRRLTYIETGLEPDGRFEQRAREEAARRNWEFEIIAGDLRLFEALVSGVWDESDFLVVPPGWRVKSTYDEDVIAKEPAE